jgi:hypothetical protein
MKSAVRLNSTWLIYALFALVIAAILYSVNTSLEEQGAASGDALMDASMFPLQVITIMGLLLVADVVRLLVSKANSESDANEASETEAPIRKIDITRIGIFVIATLGYQLMLDSVGYLLLTPFYLMIVFRAFNAANLVWSSIGALVVSSTLFYLFENVLNVILPIGLLRFIS